MKLRYKSFYNLARKIFNKTNPTLIDVIQEGERLIGVYHYESSSNSSSSKRTVVSREITFIPPYYTDYSFHGKMVFVEDTPYMVEINLCPQNLQYDLKVYPI